MKTFGILHPIQSLVVRKERWGLSRRGWLVFLCVSIFSGYLFVTKIHSFLAVTDRVPANVLVIEGWLDPYAVEAAMTEFKSGSYQKLITTGGPEEGMGNYCPVYDTQAHQSAGFLKKAGIPQTVIQSVPSLIVGKDRTYHSALALRKWFQEHDLQVGSFNVLTADVHARRTRLLFQEAFGSQTKVGIISVPNPDYDARHWWRSSEGVRKVVDETIAYIYAKFLFWPSTASSRLTS